MFMDSIITCITLVVLECRWVICSVCRSVGDELLLRNFAVPFFFVREKSKVFAITDQSALIFLTCAPTRRTYLPKCTPCRKIRFKRIVYSFILRCWKILISNRFSSSRVGDIILNEKSKFKVFIVLFLSLLSRSSEISTIAMDNGFCKEYHFLCNFFFIK